MKRLLLAAALALAALSSPVVAQPAPSFTIDNATAAEDSGSIVFTIRKHGTLNNRPSSISFDVFPGTATAGADYQRVSVDLVFTASQTSRTVTVPLVNDDRPEPTETFTAKIVRGQNSRLYRGTATGTITDSDTAPAPVPTPSPSPTPPPPAAGWVPSPSLNGAPDLVASFPVREGLHPSWGDGSIPGIYDANEGAFRLTCGGELMPVYDDPLVYPGKPGASHLHYPFGASPFDAYMTADTLARVTVSTCNNGTTKTLNRSGYWIPALVDDQGFVRMADWIALYYKRMTANSPACTGIGGNRTGICVGLPNQIRFLAGWDQFAPDEPGKGNSWYCSGGTGGHFRDLDAVFQSGCKPGDDLIADLAFPNCWDGKHLDSPNHRDHVAWGSYGSWGYYKCPDSHPYLFPQPETKYKWTVTADMIGTRPDGSVYSRIRLASDHMKPGAKPGETFHGDYIEGWVGEAKRMWIDHCINRGLNCSGGDLGNGLQIAGASQPRYGWVNPVPRVPIPANPHASH
jgi:hypothetical protein